MKRKTIQKVLAAICTTTVLTGMLAGCGATADAGKSEKSTDKETASEAEDTETKESVTLSLLLPTTWNTDALAKGISMYEEATGNKIQIEAVPDDQCMDLVKTRLATKTDVPDILAQNGEFTAEQMSAYFEPLDGEWIQKLNPDHLEKVYKLATDGNVYRAPYGSASALGLIYNKKVMEDNGIKLPIMSYTDWMAACETLKANGVTPVSISNKEGWTAQILGLDQQWNGFTSEDFTALKTGKLNFKDNKNLQTLFQNMISIKDKGYINEDYMSTTMDMSIEDVATGECAMTPAGDWSYSALQTNFPDKVEEVGMMPVPVRDDSIYLNIGASSKYFWSTKDGKNQNADAAKEFINFMLADETMQAMYEIEPGICPIQGLEVKQNSWNAEMTGYAQEIPYAPIAGEMNGFNPGNFPGAVQQLFGGKSVEDSLSYWYDDCVQVNKAAGTEGF